MPELRPESWGHSGDQGEQRTPGGSTRLVPFRGQGERVPSCRVGVREGCLEFFHIRFFMTTVEVLNIFPLFWNADGRDGSSPYLLHFTLNIRMITQSGSGPLW